MRAWERDRSAFDDGLLEAHNGILVFFVFVTAARMANEQTGVWVVGFPSGRVGE